jgi:RHS repeat-associated protein
MDMPGRSYGSPGRYGFNGKERDKEATQYDYGFRIYDPRLGRFKSVDPLFQSYPWYTPYQFAGNMPIWAMDLDGLEEMKANSTAQVIKNIKGDIITNTTVIRASGNYFNDIPGIRRIDDNFIEVTPGLIDKKDPYFNTFTWQQVNGKDFSCTQSITPIGGEAGGTVKLPKSNLVQDNDDAPVPVNNKPTTVITPVSNTQVQNQAITRNINFVGGQPQFASNGDKQMVNQVAANAPNSLVTGQPRTTTNGNTATTTTRTRQVRSIITIDLMTNNQESWVFRSTNARKLQTERFNLLKKQLTDQGVPAGNIRRGSTLYGVPLDQMGGNPNQTIFRVRTTNTTSTTGTSTTTQ